MTRSELREEVADIAGDYPDMVDALMSAVDKYVEGVIGEDDTEETYYAEDDHDQFVKNFLRDEQRRRAGLEGKI